MGITGREGIEENKVCDTCKWNRYKMTVMARLVTPCNECCDYSDWEPEDSCSITDGLRPKVPACSVAESRFPIAYVVPLNMGKRALII